MRGLSRFTLTLGMAGALALGSTVVFSEAKAWSPKKPVQFVIMAGKGGGADKMARLMQSTIEKENLSSTRSAWIHYD